MNNIKELLEELKAQNAQVEAAFDQLRAMPAEITFALPSEVLGELDEACAPRVASPVNPLALRA